VHIQDINSSNHLQSHICPGRSFGGKKNNFRMVLDTHGSMGTTKPCQHIPLFHTVCRMKEHAATVVSDDAFARRAERWPEETPDTKEAFFIRDIFDSQHLSSLVTFSWTQTTQVYFLQRLLRRLLFGMPFFIVLTVYFCSRV